MNIENLDMEKLWEMERGNCPWVFSRWTETARDAATQTLGNRGTQICHSLTITGECYEDIPQQEFRKDQLVSFIESILHKLPNEDSRRKLLEAEAFGCLIGAEG